MTLFLVLKLKKTESKVVEINKIVIDNKDIIVKSFSKVKNIVTNTNRVVSILTSKKLLQIRNILKYTLNTIEIIVFIRTLDFSKGIKGSFNRRNLRKILFAKVTKRLIFKILGSVCG